MYAEAFGAGVRFGQFLELAANNRELWYQMAARARVAPESIERARGISGEWRLLAIADDWCGDAVNILPAVARLVQHLGTTELRIVSREEWPELMERHRTNGGRSIPVLILLDSAYRRRGWWGPRPSALQAWFEANGRALPKEARYRELRRWYDRSRGTAVVEEILDLISCAMSGSQEERCQGVRVCAETPAA